MFSLAGAEKRHGEVIAVRGIDLEVPAHRTLALIGASGSGKSTLLRLMLGLERPDRGEIRFDGQLVDESNVEAIRRQVGYVIQEGGLFPHLSAADNIDILARHLGWAAARRNERIQELCELTDMSVESLTRPPTQLSGGQRQRVALMRALMLDPKVVLLDEPLGALDPLIRYDLQNELARIFDALDKTVVLVTHDLNEAVFLAHEIVLLDAGSIVQRGTHSELEEHPSSDFVRRFLRAQHGLHGARGRRREENEA